MWHVWVWGEGGEVRMIVRDTSEGRLRWKEGEVMSGERGGGVGLRKREGKC